METKTRSGGLIALVVFLSVLLAALCAVAVWLNVAPPSALEQMLGVQTTAHTEATTVETTQAETEYVIVTLPLSGPLGTIQTFATAHGLTVADYPKSLVYLLERNPETEEFVLNYPLEHDQPHEIDLSEYEDSETMPLFLQWDRRWGYIPYGADMAALTACGPVCLSMVAFYLTGDPETSPDKMIAYAGDNGYYTPGKGTAWSFISEAGAHFGLRVRSITVDQIMDALDAGRPVICVMGPGDFTQSGHFIVMASSEDGMIRVNDPNSIANSEKLWDLADIRDQIHACWSLDYNG